MLTHASLRGLTWTVVAILCSAIAVTVVAQDLSGEGVKQTDRFIKAGGETSQSVAVAKLQVGSTLAAYNTLVSTPSKNLKGDYKKLLGSVKNTNRAVAAAQRQVADMEAQGQTYFAGRTTNTASITSPELRQLAQQRFADSRQQYDGVMDGLRGAAGALAPFMTALGDNISFLGSDLTPSAVTALKPEADRLNLQGAGVFSAADQAIATANTYFRSLASK